MLEKKLLMVLLNKRGVRRCTVRLIMLKGDSTIRLIKQHLNKVQLNSFGLLQKLKDLRHPLRNVFFRWFRSASYYILARRSAVSSWCVHAVRSVLRLQQPRPASVPLRPLSNSLGIFSHMSKVCSLPSPPCSSAPCLLPLRCTRSSTRVSRSYTA